MTQKTKFHKAIKMVPPPASATGIHKGVKKTRREVVVAALLDVLQGGGEYFRIGKFKNHNSASAQGVYARQVVREMALPIEIVIRGNGVFARATMTASHTQTGKMKIAA